MVLQMLPVSSEQNECRSRARIATKNRLRSKVARSPRNRRTYQERTLGNMRSEAKQIIVELESTRHFLQCRHFYHSYCSQQQGHGVVGASQPHASRPVCLQLVYLCTCFVFRLPPRQPQDEVSHMNKSYQPETLVLKT